MVDRIVNTQFGQLTPLIANAAKTNADFGALGNLTNSYWEGLQQHRLQQQQDLFKNGVPMKDGVPDIGQIVQSAARVGGLPALQALLPSLLQQQKMEFGSKFEGGVPGGSPAMVPSVSAPQAPQQTRPTAPAPQIAATPQTDSMGFSPREIAQANPLSADPTLGGIVPMGTDAETYVKYLERGLSSGMLNEERAKSVRDRINAINEALKQHREHALKAVDPTEDQKKYNAEMAGRPPQARVPYEQWSQEKSASAARLEGDKKAMDVAVEQAMSVARVRPILNEAIRLSTQTPEGLRGALSPHFSKVLSGLGLPVSPGMSNAEALRSASMMLISIVRQPGAQSNAEMENYISALPSLMQSAEGRLKIGRMIVRMADRSQEIARIYRDNLGKPDLFTKIEALDKKPVFSKDEASLINRSLTELQNLNPQAIVDELRNRGLAK